MIDPEKLKALTEDDVDKAYPRIFSIDRLSPLMVPKAYSIQNFIKEQAIPLRIYETLRLIERQLWYFYTGASKEKLGLHPLGFAFDLAITKKGLTAQEETELYEMVGSKASSWGLTWGKSWGFPFTKDEIEDAHSKGDMTNINYPTFVDEPHYQLFHTYDLLTGKPYLTVQKIFEPLYFSKGLPAVWEFVDHHYMSDLF